MKSRLLWGIVALVIALGVASGMAVRSMIRADRYESRLREVYDGALLSALRQMEDMQLALSKALLSGDSGAEAEYLNQVSAGAAQVQRSLSLLPLSHTAAQNAVKFANQAADYSSVLIRTGQMTEEDAQTIGSLIAACEEYAAALAQAKESLSAKAVAGGDPFYPSQAALEAPAYDSAVSYPTLIYDGPFSDARKTGSAQALGPKAVSLDDALLIARDFAGSERVQGISVGAEMGGDIPCWGVTLNCGDVTLQAAVTKQGGKVLWMAPDTADFAAQRSVEECRENALKFLSERGYENMQATYFQVYQGVAVISFAATQGSTLLYPDLIKVQLRLDTAQVVGIEARNYLQNHSARGPLIPSLTEDQARERVGERLKIDSARLCLIPTDGGEKLCYEFQGEFAGHMYLSYINALDGRQEQLLKVVEGETGLEAV
ncbi:MAG: germination protein YpeB [Clostridia bacterium]|nr:germination protein YpeB [Clostridia bacterium]